MGLLNKKISVLTLLIIALAAGGAYYLYASQPGGKFWCSAMEAKPKSDWSFNDATLYAKHCVFAD